MSETTTVRLSARAKAKLDRLQAKLALTKVARLSKDELLERLIDLGSQMPDRLGPGFPRFSAEHMARFRALPVHTGKRTREEDIDRDLYGEPPH